VAIHAGILKARPEVGAIIHFHPKAATLFSMVEDVVPAAMKNHAYCWRGGIPVHPDSSLFKTATQGDDLAKMLGPHLVYLLRAHGAVVVAEDVRSMMIDAIHFEENAEAYIQASVLGTPKLPSAEETLAMKSTFDRDRHIPKLWKYYLGLAREQGAVSAGWNG
jgi:ribulose-5-phosphate 4-epimerase/fuculose-1-phosphate aldolase